MGATLKDVAKLSGVHPSTVSRVLRGKEILQISEETKRKILESAKKLNYQPDQTARSLRLKKSHTIGMIIPNISSPYFAGIAKSVATECTRAGYTLVLSDTNENQENEIRAVNDLYSRGVDGLIIAPVQESNQHIRDLVDKNFPFVIIDRKFDDLSANAVISNDKESGFTAVNHLLGLGHTRIGFICGRPNLYPVLKRLDGYKEALIQNELCIDDNLISSGGPTMDSGYASASKLLELENPPTALLISGTIITIGVIKAILENNKEIPKDISIIGFTDANFAPYLIKPLTTISHKYHEIGIKSFELLYSQLKSGKSILPSSVIVESKMVIRGSTARVPLAAQESAQSEF